MDIFESGELKAKHHSLCVYLKCVLTGNKVGKSRFLLICRISQRKSESAFDPEELSGETIRVGLRKGPRGFGFTIVGGEQSGQALQVNNIVRGGVAALDGRLRTGDTIIRLNGRNILSWTHQDIVRWLQGTRVSKNI